LDEGASNYDQGGGSRLLLTEEEWLARHRSGAGKKKRNFDIRKVRCYTCQEYGHYSRDCTEPKKERALLTLSWLKLPPPSMASHTRWASMFTFMISDHSK